MTICLFFNLLRTTNVFTLRDFFLILYTLESRIIGGFGIIAGLDFVIIINNEGGGVDGVFSFSEHNAFLFFSSNGHIFPIQFNTRKLRNDGI